MIDRKNCPDCGSSLGKGAYKCRCGWKATEQGPALQHIACCYADCGISALVRVRTSTGWANVCLEHYPRIDIAPPKRLAEAA